jgi:hypothetical protein
VLQLHLHLQHLLPLEQAEHRFSIEDSANKQDRSSGAKQLLHAVQVELQATMKLQLSELLNDLQTKAKAAGDGQHVPGMPKPTQGLLKLVAETFPEPDSHSGRVLMHKLQSVLCSEVLKALEVLGSTSRKGSELLNALKGDLPVLLSACAAVPRQRRLPGNCRLPVRRAGHHMAP